MTVDPAVVPGLLLLALELLALATIGYAVARVGLGQTDDRLALAQGLVIGPALWRLIASYTSHLLPGMNGSNTRTLGVSVRGLWGLRLPYLFS